MSSMKNDLVDKRTIDRNIRKGLISKEDYQNYLSQLDDAEGKFELVRFETDAPAPPAASAAAEPTLSAPTFPEPTPSEPTPGDPTPPPFSY